MDPLGPSPENKRNVGIQRDLEMKRLFFCHWKTNLLNILIVFVFLLSVLWFFRMIEWGFWRSKSEANTVQKMEILRVIIQKFSREKGALPTSEEGLKDVISGLFTNNTLTEWNDRYYRFDGWGNEFRYEYQSVKKRCVLTSAGRDGTFDTRDDLALYVNETAE